MLFNSHFFIFAFLPVVLVGYYSIAHAVSAKAALAFLAFVSLCFYQSKLVIILLSAGLLTFLVTRYVRGIAQVIVGVSANLLLLSYFKYSVFFAGVFSQISGKALSFDKIALPLGISFYTFQNISYLVDTYSRKIKDRDLLSFATYMLFFPKLIAGPITRYNEFEPQLRNAKIKFEFLSLSSGFTIFAIGLFKKVVIADNISAYVTPVFATVHAGYVPHLIYAWGGMLTYALQIYFDFSGYSEMAAGVAMLFGVRLPLNFNSPYKARSMIEFWQRWHMSLSRFMSDYVYFPLARVFRAPSWFYLSLFFTMVLCGLWHGAGWTFVVWGGFHGACLMVNYLWRNQFGRKIKFFEKTVLGRILSQGLTFFAVVMSYAFFRSETIADAFSMLKGMAGLNGIVLPIGAQPILGNLLKPLGVQFLSMPYDKYGIASYALLWVPLLYLIVFFAPNTFELMRSTRPVVEQIKTKVKIEWHPSLKWSSFVSLLFALSILMMNGVSEFIYFQF